MSTTTSTTSTTSNVISLAADPRYEPLARGMRAALPFVDDFASGHDLASLTAVADRLAALRA